MQNIIFIFKKFKNTKSVQLWEGGGGKAAAVLPAGLSLGGRVFFNETIVPGHNVFTSPVAD